MWSTSDALDRSGVRAVRTCIGIALVIVLLAVLGGRAAVAGAQPAGQQRGFALPTWQVDGYDAPSLEQSLREVSAAGANWVQFTPTWSQQGRNSSAVFPTQRTVSDPGLRRAITLAHGLGLNVFLKPHIDLADPLRDSRNTINPDDRAAWFTSYTAFITHYAAIAQESGVEQFSVGAELSSISDDRAAWLQVIGAVRDRYDGTLTYAAGRDWDRVPFWDALDLIGIDAYPPLSPSPTTDVSALRQAFDPYVEKLATMSATFGRKILFTEAGFTSQDGTTTDPSDWRISRTPNPAEQSAGYEALLATFSGQPWWAGVFWWVWITPPATEAEPLDFSPRGKAAEEVIRRWWTT